MAKHVLLPIDIQHEESWKVALPMARRLMDAGDVLHLLGIVHDVGNAWVASYLPKGFEKQALEKLKYDLEDFAARECQGLEVVPHVSHGHVAETILKKADKIGAAMIVMASHKPDQMRTFRVGSQADRVVVAHSPVTVVVVR